VRDKAELRKAELEAADRHFERLREGRPESLETTSLHPVLEAAGELPAREAADDAANARITYQPKLL
jgi:phosphate:Na+ symporter